MFSAIATASSRPIIGVSSGAELGLGAQALQKWTAPRPVGHEPVCPPLPAVAPRAAPPVRLGSEHRPAPLGATGERVPGLCVLVGVQTRHLFVGKRGCQLVTHVTSDSCQSTAFTCLAACKCVVSRKTAMATRSSATTWFSGPWAGSLPPRFHPVVRAAAKGDERVGPVRCEADAQPTRGDFFVVLL